MSMTRRGTTVVELLVGVTILTLILAAVFKMTSAGQRSAVQVMKSHQVNEEIQRAIEYFSDDVREGNVIVDTGGGNTTLMLTLNAGQTLEEALAAAVQAGALKTEDPVNKVKLMKCRVVSPSQVTGGTASGMVKKAIVEYFFKGTGDTRALIRKYVELDTSNNEVAASARIKPIISEIRIAKDYALFFRIGGNQPNIGARNIYFAADIARKEKLADGTFSSRETFHASVFTSAHIRGSAPDRF